ncbi:MAG: ABC transporter ATP-binding protein [Thermodesulfovibrionales bacterium]
MLKVDSLSKRFDGVQAVRDASFNIQQGTVTSLIGPNGAGKTTLFNMICGYIKPDGGTVHFKGKDINASPPYAIAAMGIGRTFQNLRVIKMLTVLDNILLSVPDHQMNGILGPIFKVLRKNSELGCREKALELLDFVGLREKADDLAGSLSYGQQKLLSLACCFALEPSVLLLDEPVAGVNQEMIINILTLIRRLKETGIAVFFIEHNLGAVMEVSDRLIVMDEGSIIADGIPSVVREDPAVVEAYIR